MPINIFAINTLRFLNRFMLIIDNKTTINMDKSGILFPIYPYTVNYFLI